MSCTWFAGGSCAHARLTGTMASNPPTMQGRRAKEPQVFDERVDADFICSPVRVDDWLF
jgi:hypothetical protein